MMAVLILLVVFGAVAVMTSRDYARARNPLPEHTAATTPLLTPAPAAAPISPETLVLALPEPARTQAWQLLCLVHDGLEDVSQADAQARFLLLQTRQSYLPDTLRAYLRLTEGARRHLAAQGQTPEQLLNEQLALMTSGVQGALRRDHAAADHLLTQGRFLRERFGSAADLLAGEER